MPLCTWRDPDHINKTIDRELIKLLDEIKARTGDTFYIEEKRRQVKRLFRKPIEKVEYELLKSLGGGEMQIVLSAGSNRISVLAWLLGIVNGLDAKPKPIPQEDKCRHFFTRTMQHIDRVRQHALYLVCDHARELSLDLDDCRQLLFNVCRHDATKFSPEQFDAYVNFTWSRLSQTAQSDQDKEAFMKAWKHHYTYETHHPERLKGIAIKMAKHDLVEIVCDLQAMADELGEGSCRKYFEETWINQHSQNFYDDYDWDQVKGYMSLVITCLENRGK